MIFIEIDIGGMINQIKDSDERNSWLEFKADTECFSILNETERIVANNYFWQDSYVCQVMQNELEKAEKELFKKWNLEDGIYVNDEDSPLANVLYNTLSKEFINAKTMAEVNNETVLSNSKEQIVNYFNKELDKYAKRYNVEKELIKQVKADMPNVVEIHFDKTADKLFNNNTRDKLESLCNNWEKEYKKLNYEKMNEISQKILSKFQKPGTIYRDEELESKLREVVTKNQFIQNKLANGENGKLTEIEENVIMRYLDIDRNKESSKNEDNIIEEFTKEIKQKIQEL